MPAVRLRQLAGHDHALDLVGTFIDLGDTGAREQFPQVDGIFSGRLSAPIQHSTSHVAIDHCCRTCSDCRLLASGHLNQ